MKPTIILAVDPGPEQSAVVEWDGNTILRARIAQNDTLLCEDLPMSNADIMAVEQIKSYGMAVSDSIFDTVFWSGRFCQLWSERPKPWVRVPRREIKLHLCGSMRAKDSNVRQALIDRFGVPGTKKNPGLTYGLSKDLWQAFALAVYMTDVGIQTGLA